MSVIPYQNGNFPVEEHEVIFHEGQDCQSINILTKGKADVFISPDSEIEGKSEEDIIKESFRIFTVPQNTFLGADGMFIDTPYQVSYRAATKGSVYVFMMDDIEKTKNLLHAKKDYGAYVISSLSSLITHSAHMLQKQLHLLTKIERVSDMLGIFFWHQKNTIGYQRASNDPFFKRVRSMYDTLLDAGVSLPLTFDEDFLETDFSIHLDTSYERKPNIPLEKIDYYRRLLKVPFNVRKQFYGVDVFLTMHVGKEAATFYKIILEEIRKTFIEGREIFERFYADGKDCLFIEFAKAAIEVRDAGKDPGVLISAAEYIVDTIKDVVGTYEKEYLHEPETDLDYVESMLQQAKTPPQTESEDGERAGEGVSASGAENLPQELQDSAKKIIEFSGIPTEKATIFMENLQAFREMRDRLSTDESARRIRKAVTNVYFDIYEGVFRRMLETKSEAPLFRMFLDYGYMDEQLLRPDQVLTLYKLTDTSRIDPEVGVYTMSDWLQKIYNEEKVPSYNGFGQDYRAIFFEMKKRGEVTDADYDEYMADNSKKLKNEVHGMIKETQRLCFGQISIYFPILHQDVITKDFSKSFVTRAGVAEEVKKLLDIDFSAYHREVLFKDPERGIEKEFIIKKVIPDFLLMPTYGTRMMMWQELSSNKKSSRGRILLPVFTAENLFDLIVAATGRFRWELCKTMLGPSWNDISTSSLTADYSDYIQFYRKNRDLSEEAREKVKILITRCRNDIREIFASEYELWVNYEAKGIMRLNKVTRGILYRHVPFAKTIRDKIEKQPMFSEIAHKFKNIRKKKTREVENHYHKFTKTGDPLPPELAETLAFYKDM